MTGKIIVFSSRLAIRYLSFVFERKKEERGKKVFLWDLFFLEIPNIASAPLWHPRNRGRGLPVKVVFRLLNTAVGIGKGGPETGWVSVLGPRARAATPGKGALQP
jgi:hypothetical protein